MSTATWLQNARHQQVRVDGRLVSYLEIGKGERTCVLIHGLAGSWDHWTHIIPALTQTHRVIALDLPGFGRSQRGKAHGIEDQCRAVASVLDTAGVHHCDIVGSSLGTLIACQLAVQEPERVGQLVLCGGPILSVFDLRDRPVRTLMRRPKTVAFLIEALTAGLRPPKVLRHLILTTTWARWIAFRVYTPQPTKLGSDDLRALLFGVGAPGVLPTLWQNLRYDPRSVLSAVSQPTIVINGESDIICPPADAHEFAKSNSAVHDVVVIPGAGHLPMIEAPEQFNGYLTDFLAVGALSSRRPA